MTNENGTTTLTGNMSLSGNCIFGIAGTALSNYCALSGNGSLVMIGSARMSLGGNVNYTPTAYHR